MGRLSGVWEVVHNFEVVPGSTMVSAHRVLLGTTVALLLANAAEAFVLGTSRPCSAMPRLAAPVATAEPAAPDAAGGAAPEAFIEFIVGVPEPAVPDVKLTRSRDGTTGVATFTFDNPSFLAASTAELGETTGLATPCHARHLGRSC